MRSSRILFFILVSLLVTVNAVAQQQQCDPVTAIEFCSANELNTLLQDRARNATPAADEVSERVVNTNKAVTAPDPFAARIHASYQDFLVPLSFAINSIEESEDGRALIARLNPFRRPPVVAGVTITTTKPSLDERVAQAIPESGRDAAVERLTDELDDLSDLMVALSAAAETTECTDDKKLCWGRNPRTYRQLLSRALLALAPAPSSSEANAAFIQLGQAVTAAATASGVSINFDTKLGLIPEPHRAAVLAAMRDLVAADVADRNRYLAQFAERHLDGMAALIDNQPQASLSATRRERDDVVGPSELAGTLEVQFGWNNNLNAVKRNCAGSFESCVASALREGVSDAKSGKFVLSISYKETERLQLGADAVGVDDFTAIDVPRIREWSGKLQWGKRMNRRVGEQQMRWDIVAEGVRITRGGQRTKNDWIATGTVTLPLANNMSIPVSLKYGNRQDLIEDVRKRWTAHFGISYRLPWEQKAE